MKFAAIKAQMGIWKYYVTTLTFEDISNCVVIQIYFKDR